MLAPNLDELLEQLNEVAPQLTTTRLMLLNRMASALQVRFDGFVNPSSDLATPLFSEYFASRLLIDLLQNQAKGVNQDSVDSH